MRGRLARLIAMLALSALAIVIVVDRSAEDELATIAACTKTFVGGLPPIAADRTGRFEGKVDWAHALCRGGDKAVGGMGVPWVDWQNYWATGNAGSKSARMDAGSFITGRNMRGINGALIDLEYQRMELIKFNLFDNQTYQTYVMGDGHGTDGPAVKIWKEMRLPPDHPDFHALKVGADGSQQCVGELTRFRTVTGICNDARNPAMGS